MVMGKIETDPTGAFRRDIKRISKGVDDLRPALLQVKKQWYQGNKSIFALSGPGKYPELSSSYAKRKSREVGSIYPLLRGRNKRIEKAITKPSNENAYSKVFKKDVELGVQKTSDFPYAFSIHYGSKKQNIPARPYVLLGVEQVATKDQRKKTKVYLDLIGDYVLQVSEGKK